MRAEEMNIPHLFRCPISLDLFEDPVTLCTGQTYDRSNIQKWLEAGNLTCPVTMQKLQDPSLVPNHTLQHLINHWLCMDNRFSPDDACTYDSNFTLAVLKHDIESRDSVSNVRIEALRRIKSLSEELEWRRDRLVKLGFFESILKLVFSVAEANLSREGLDIAEECLQCIVNLMPSSDMRSLNMLKESSCLAKFRVLLEQGSTKTKMNLCSLIEAITSSLKTRELCLVLGQAQPLVRVLLDLVSGNAEASEAANKAVLALCSLKLNRDCFVREGAVDSLLSYLSSPSRRSQTSVALTTLEHLLESDAARVELGRNSNGIHVLVQMVFGVCFDNKGSESAVSSLLSVCCESAKAREEAISAGVLTQLLLLLQSQCSSRAKNKARVLLKLLRST